MIRVFRSEWRKIHRPTRFAGTLGIVFGLSVLITALLFILLDSDGGNGPRGRIITRETLALPSGLYLGFTNFAGLLGTIALSV
ncbi:MAG: ABC transporter permease, partial [Actinomycetota bacterium]